MKNLYDVRMIIEIEEDLYLDEDGDVNRYLIAKEIEKVIADSKKIILADDIKTSEL